MPEENLALLLILIPLAMLGGLAAGTTGFGIYLLFGPFLWYALPPTAALATGLAAGLPALLLLYHLRRFVLWTPVKTITLLSLPGVALGLVLHTLASPSLLRALAAVAILLLLLLTYLARRPFAYSFSGLSAGALGASVGFNGPAVSVAFLNAEEGVQRANTILSLFFVSLVTSGAFLLSALFSEGIQGEDFFSGYLLGLTLIPPVALGLFLGNRLAQKIGTKIEWVALLLSVLGAFLLLLRAFYLL